MLNIMVKRICKIADKVDIDILKNEANIFMFEKNDKVQVKYKN